MRRNKKTHKSIAALASELLKEQEKFCSWGAEKIKIEKNTMSFSVSGFKFCGEIWIIANSENSYKIVLESPIYKKVIENVTLAEIVEIIDRKVEITDNYVKTLLNCFFFDYFCYLKVDKQQKCTACNKRFGVSRDVCSQKV